MMIFRGMFLGAILVAVGLNVAACSGPVALYHDAEGGAIATARQAPPGASQPYPNLASVPAAPNVAAPGVPAPPAPNVSAPPAPAVKDVSPPAPGALAGLELPAAPPPPPQIAGLNIPAAPKPSAPLPAPVVVRPAQPASVPVALAFAPGSALLLPETARALAALAAAQGNATLLVGGFGEAQGAPGDASALALGLARAVRLADGLTADGVPAGTIKLQAGAAGSGGFVQLVY